MISIEVIYALKEAAVCQTYRLPEGASVTAALSAARADPKFAGVDWERAAVGVYGQPVSAEQRLNEGDRLEIYRPLLEDPKLARRRRAKKSYGP